MATGKRALHGNKKNEFAKFHNLFSMLRILNLLIIASYTYYNYI